MNALRVLHVAQPTTAGVARVVADLVTDQVARGWSVAVACPLDGWLPGDVAASGAVLHPWTATRDPGPSVVAEVRRLRRIVREVRPDVLHLHSSKAGLAGRLAVRGRIPTVFHPHAWSFLAVAGPVARAATAWERLGARWARVIAVVSDDERTIGAAAGVSGQYVVLPNGVDLQVHPMAAPDAAARARRDLGLPDAPVAVCVGRLCRQKGQDVLLAAWPDVVAAVPAAQLVLVGDGPDEAAVAAAAGPQVRVVGAQTDVTPWLVAADVVVLPSRWEAGLSLVAMEAMAAGRSVVATDVAGMAAGLGTGCGEVVPVDDVPALTEAVAHRLSDRSLAAREGAAGRQRVEREHDLVKTTAAVAGLYERVLAEG